MSNILIFLFEISVNLFESYLLVDFIEKFNGSKFIGYKRIIFYILAIVLLFADVTISNYIDTSIEVANYIAIIILIIYSMFALYGNPLIKISSCIFINVILIFINGFSIFVFSLIFDKNLELIMDTFGTYRFIMLISSKIILFSVLKIILKFKSIRHKNIPSSSWILITVIPLLTIFIMVTITESATYNEDTRLTFYLSLSIIGLIIMNVIFYYTFMSTIRNHEVFLENQLLKNNIELKKKHSIELVNLYKEIQTIRHNMKNQLIGAYTLIKDSQYDKAIIYLANLINDIDSTKKYIFTKNEMLNSIVNKKFTEANNKGIKTAFSINYDLGNKIDFIDINILFGNLFDNAIEACEKINGEKEIFLAIEKKRGYISIKVTNTIESSVLKNNPNLLTSKIDKSNHGLGVPSIKKIVQKYDGLIEFYETKNSFTSNILILE